jgi:hypothetical protein
MGYRKNNTPVYHRFIDLVKKGFATLDEKNQNEVIEFIKSCQHSEGGFTDRAGKPDLYYSLFGTWLSVALDEMQIQVQHKKFIARLSEIHENTVEEFASLLIKISIPGYDFKKPSFFSMLNRMLFKSSRVNFFYRIFLFILIIDALYRPKIIYPLMRGILGFYSPPADSPCSVHAAITVARSESGLDVKREQQVLFSHFEEGKGFKAFRSTEEPDLLSTAVALFALKTTDADLRKIAPDCLDFIQQNYENGAFLAGNGDEIRDLEYTFYGLLALGTLV